MSNNIIDKLLPSAVIDIHYSDNSIMAKDACVEDIQLVMTDSSLRYKIKMVCLHDNFTINGDFLMLTIISNCYLPNNSNFKILVADNEIPVNIDYLSIEKSSEIHSSYLPIPFLLPIDSSIVEFMVSINVEDITNFNQIKHRSVESRYEILDL